MAELKKGDTASAPIVTHAEKADFIATIRDSIPDAKRCLDHLHALIDDSGVTPTIYPACEFTLPEEQEDGSVTFIVTVKPENSHLRVSHAPKDTPLGMSITN